MKKFLKYCVFETKWGYFGLAGNDFSISRTILPGTNPKAVESELLAHEVQAQNDRNYFKDVQKAILAYFEGDYIQFEQDIPLDISQFGDFTQAILNHCRNVKYADTVTYNYLAKICGNDKASRAVGYAMSVNPIPLIIPCHRVLRKDGGLGGFSASGGVVLKQRLVEHERQCRR